MSEFDSRDIVGKRLTEKALKEMKEILSREWDSKYMGLRKIELSNNVAKRLNISPDNVTEGMMRVEAHRRFIEWIEKGESYGAKS